MIDFLRSVFGKKTQPLNKIYVNPRAYLQNFEYLQSLHPHNALFPVIKSNAYGHGLKEIASILKDVPLTYLCIDSFPEYAIASKYNKHNYLVLSETNAENYRLYNWKRVAFAISSFHGLEYFAKKGKNVRIHLFINTGLHREWFDLEDLEKVIEILRSAPHIQLEGIMSHLAEADNADGTKTNEQIARFKSMHKIISDAGFSPTFRHIGASAGLFSIDDPFFTARRPGLALYGYSPLSGEHPKQHLTKPLQVCARVTSTIIGIRTIPANERIGYWGTRKAWEDTKIALVPFGYYEWLPRLLSNARYEKSKNSFLPVLGTISMNYHTVGIWPLSKAKADGDDATETISQIPDLCVWNEIEIFGKDSLAQNSLLSAAKTAKTNIYEIMTWRNEKTKRIILDEPIE